MNAQRIPHSQNHNVTSTSPNFRSMHKSNCNNSLIKFYDPSIEYVTKLKFYNPESTGHKTLYNLKKLNAVEKKDKTSRKEQNLTTEPESHNHKYIHILKNEKYSQETSQENKRKQIESKIKELKAEEARFFNILTNTKKEVKDLEVEVEVLDKFYKYSGFEEKYNNFLAGAGRKSKDRDNEMYEKLMKTKKLMDLEEEKRNQDLIRKQQEIIQKTLYVERIRETVSNIQGNLKLLNEELIEVKNGLLVHYHNLLSEGRDTRKEGLVWIIKAIWNLGEKVIPSYLPSFLDEKAIAYLYNYAQKDVELSKLKKKLDSIHLKMKIKREMVCMKEKRSKKNVLVFSETNDTFKTGLSSAREDDLLDLDLNKNVIKFLIEKHKRENMIYNEAFTFKKIQELLSKKGKLEDEALEYIRTVKSLEKDYKNLSTLMQEMKRLELNRINKEFYAYDYERRFQISQENIISALIGEENTLNELMRQRREQNKYYQDLESVRSFNMLQSLLNKK